MRVWPVAAGRFGWWRVVTSSVTRNRAPADEVPRRTVYNSQTGQFEEMPLSELQQLLAQGRIQETVRRRQDGPARRVFLLI